MGEVGESLAALDTFTTWWLCGDVGVGGGVCVDGQFGSLYK